MLVTNICTDLCTDISMAPYSGAPNERKGNHPILRATLTRLCRVDREERFHCTTKDALELGQKLPCQCWCQTKHAQDQPPCDFTAGKAPCLSLLVSLLLFQGNAIPQFSTTTAQQPVRCKGAETQADKELKKMHAHKHTNQV